MSDINNLPPAQVPQEWLTQETSQEPEPLVQEEPVVTPQEPVQEMRQESDSAKNLRALREAKERVERERDEAFRMIQEMQSRYKQTEVEPVNEDISLGESDLVEGKHLSQVDKKIKRLEQELKNYQQKSFEMSVETKLKSQYPDFDKIVSRENIDSLKASYPEIASALNASPDLYSKAVSAYTLIKKLGIYTEDLYASERALAQKNAAKPRPLASVAPQKADSPLSHANAFAQGLSDDLKAQLRREMEEARRSL